MRAVRFKLFAGRIFFKPFAATTLFRAGWCCLPGHHLVSALAGRRPFLPRRGRRCTWLIAAACLAWRLLTVHVWMCGLWNRRSARLHGGRAALV